MEKSNANLLPLALHSAAVASEQLAKPSIVVVIADDLGYGDIFCNGATRITEQTNESRIFFNL